MFEIYHRGIYILSICFFITVGFLLMAIGDPQYVKPIVSEEVFKAMYPAETPEPNKLFVLGGFTIVLFSFIIGLFGGLVCKFGKKDFIPRKVDVLRAQDNSVFLIDGETYQRDEASFYNLKDLSRIRLRSIRNLFSFELQRDIAIAPEEIVNETKTTPDRNPETTEQGAGSNNKESYSERTSIK